MYDVIEMSNDSGCTCLSSRVDATVPADVIAVTINSFPQKRRTFSQRVWIGQLLSATYDSSPGV